MRLFIRCVDDEVRLGPGKIKLLEMISAHGSISEAARTMDMSYRRAWLLVAELNQLTAFGQSLIDRYRKIERDATAAVADQLQDLKADIAQA
jgi:molybdate transport system regulatory protein